MYMEHVQECLMDAGCDEALIAQFDTGYRKDQLRLLGDYRRLLLTKIHAEQKKLDLLDDLVWAVKSCASS